MRLAMDIIITVSMCYHLNIRRLMVNSSDTSNEDLEKKGHPLLRILAIYTITTGLLTVYVALSLCSTSSN